MIYSLQIRGDNMQMGDKIHQLRISQGKTLEEVGDIVGVGKSTVKKWESGAIKNMRRDKIALLAKALNTTPAYLMGWEEEKEDNSCNTPDNIIPIPSIKKVPLVGEIACGTPILADENIQEYLSCPEGIQADFCLRCKGDSMIGSRIHDGDIVYIRKQSTVDNGEIAAVLIDGEATLKKVYKTSSKITLRASNPLYEDIVLDSENEVHVLGEAVAVFFSIRKVNEKIEEINKGKIEVFAARNGDKSELSEKGKEAAEKLFDDWDNL